MDGWMNIYYFILKDYSKALLNQFQTMCTYFKLEVVLLYWLIILLIFSINFLKEANLSANRVRKLHA